MFVKGVLSISLLIWFVVLIMGCATLEKANGYYQACINDPECVVKVQSVSNSSKVIATPIVAAAGGDSGIAISIVGMLSSALAGIWYGRKDCKKG